MKLREKVWLWGHPEGRYNNAYGNEQISRMTPMECCLYLGIRNTFMIPVGWKANLGILVTDPLAIIEVMSGSYYSGEAEATEIVYEDPQT